MAAPWVEDYNNNNGAEMLFGPVSPDDFPNGVDDYQTAVQAFGSDCGYSVLGSERAWSKSPHGSIFSGYAPPAHPPQSLITNFPAPQLGLNGPNEWDPSMEIDPPAADPDSMSNSPSSSVQTPPLETPVDQFQGYISDGFFQSENGTEQSWEMVSRHGSVMSFDGFSQSPHGRPSIDSQFHAMNNGPVQQGLENIWPNTWHEGDFTALSSGEPSMQVSNSNNHAFIGNMAGFSQETHANCDHSTALIHQNDLSGMSPPWSSQRPRDYLNIAAGAGVHVFGPEYFCQSISDLAPMAQSQLPGPTYSDVSLSPDQSFPILPVSPVEQFPFPNQLTQDVPFSMSGNGMNDFANVGTTQPMTLNTSLDFLPSGSQYDIPDYILASRVSPTTADIPRTTSIDLSAMSEASWDSMQVEALPSPTHKCSPTVAPNSSESSPVFAPEVQDAQHDGQALRNGGRQLGSHLNAEKRKNANEMRELGACWPCALQRDSCGHGDPCQRCEKRRNRPNGPHPQLACDRTPLWELLEYFLPSCMTDLHQPNALMSFVNQHTHSWSNNRIRLRIIPGRNLPPMVCDVYEFHPRTNEPRRQFQYFKDTSTGEPLRRERPSPPLGMKQIEKQDQKYYSTYLNTIIEHHFEPFARMFCSDDEHEFQYRMLMHIKNFTPEATDEKKLLHDILRLIVVTYIMGHTLVLDEQSRHHALSSLSNATRASADIYGKFCSPRIVNRQLKFLFCTLHKEIMDAVYRKLQQILKRGTSWPVKWTSAFVCMLGLAMCHEDTQKTIHLIMDYKVAAEGMSKRLADSRAEMACEAIDMKYFFVMALFLRRSSKNPNPLNERDFERWWRSSPDGPGKEWMVGYRDLVLERSNYGYIQQQKYVKADRPGNFTARLVSRFLSELSGIN